MADERAELLGYFQRELAYLRAMGAGFARDYPKIAARLELDGEESADPHVERLIEAFAFLTGRIQYNLDRDFSEIPAALLQALYPQFAAPVPAMAIARFEVDPGQGKLIGGYPIARHTQLHANSNQGATCTFRTAYPVTLWPLHVADAALEPTDLHDFLDSEHTVAGVLRLRIELMAPEGEIAELGVDRLRFHLDGERNTVYQLYELLFLHCRGVAVRSDRRSAPVRLGPEAIRPVGFNVDEAVLPYPAESHQGYRLLQEYFAFPEKFLFFDVEGLRGLDAGRWFDIIVLLERNPSGRVVASAENFRLGCTPVINLFPRTSEPIRIDETRTEYRLIPDQRQERWHEVHSVVRVSMTSDVRDETRTIAPFFSFAHHGGEDSRAFWFLRRRYSERRDLPGTETFISFTDLDFTPRMPPTQVAFAHLLCTNRDLAQSLPAAALLSIEEDVPASRIHILGKPSAPITPPLQGKTLWRLISHLSLNHLSIGSGSESLVALKEILKLYDWLDERAVEQQIAGLRDMQTRKVVRRTGADAWRGFIRGTEITLTIDDRHFVGSSAFLFAAVLNRFFSLYTSINSFTQLAVARVGREGVWYRWQPLSGEQHVL